MILCEIDSGNGLSQNKIKQKTVLLWYVNDNHTNDDSDNPGKDDTIR